MLYTVSKIADKKIQEDIEIIKKIILGKLNPRAIVLFGGFGHGGGSFKILNKKIIPLNDYDIYIIMNNKINDPILEELGKECSKALGRGGMEIVEKFQDTYDEDKFFHVDLHSLEYKKLEKLYPTQRSFDLKTSLVIWGDKNVLDKIPQIKISKSDAIRLLFNKLNHFAIAEGNSNIIKSIYAVKGLTDLCSSLLIFYDKYDSKYQEREKNFQELNVPDRLKKLVSEATKSKLFYGYSIKNVERFFLESKKWVEWTLKKILREYLKIDSEDWKVICRKMYQKLPYIYFNDYLKSKYLFLGQYYLNIMFFVSGLRKRKFLIKSLMRWRDAGLIIGTAMILYSFEEENEAERYIKKITNSRKSLKKRILELYSIYYLQKLI
ncbi:MAG: hypothetical protein Q7S06_00460 [Nanoarchaeota archaeon]|nr:hypothetical protein [Nanoarchaeota archaeon]